MPEISDTELALRIKKLTLDAPAPAAIAAGVLARHRRAATARHGFPLRFAAAAVALVVALGAVGYFVPALDLAVADSPAGGAARAAGLGDVSDLVTGLDDSSTAGGLTLHLVGGYADEARTVLLVDLPANDPNVLIDSTSLNDQFGHSYTQVAAVQDISTHHAGLMFDPVVGPAVSAGARLVLHIDALRTTERVKVPGPWDLHGVVVVNVRARGIPTPADATIGGHRVHVASATAIPHGLVLTVAFPDLSATDLNAVIADGTPKGRPAVELALTRRSSTTQPFTCQFVESFGTPAFECLWLVSPGAYSLVVDYAGEKAAMPVLVPSV
jgi:hypothetical protein